MKDEIHLKKDLLPTKDEHLIMRFEASNSFIEIAPNEGGRIVKLVVDNLEIIAEPAGIPYRDSYAASLLFPFPNRIEDGIFIFDDNEYCLPCNQVQEQNALHGLIFNKNFQLVNKILDEEKITLQFKFSSDELVEGFPFKYEVAINYGLNKNVFTCGMKITNNDSRAFPFALGWHPYFLTSDKSKTTLLFKSKYQLINSHRNIPAKIKPLSQDVVLKFNQLYDDCFGLATREVQFKTPDYEMTLEFENASNYLQIYTPENTNVIAIEPMTAPANCFNNGMGLKFLEPSKTHSEAWQLTLKKNNF